MQVPPAVLRNCLFVKNKASTEKKEVGKPGDFDHMTDEDLIEFIEAQGEVVRELERQLLTPPATKQRKGATKH